MKVIRGKKNRQETGETHRVITKEQFVIAVGIIGMLEYVCSGCSLGDGQGND